MVGNLIHVLREYIQSVSADNRRDILFPTQLITYTIFLPLVIFSSPEIHLGGYFWGDVMAYERYSYLVPGQWVKTDYGANWDQVEPQQGVRIWSQALDTSMAYYRANGYKVLLNTQHAPTWARLYPDLDCSPPASAYIDDWIRFVDDLIERYKPEAIELFNEPEALPGGAFWTTCFGDNPIYYASIVSQAYQQLKPKYPAIVFVAGALILGNDFDRAWIHLFIENLVGIDAISFHSFNYDSNISSGLLESKRDYLAGLTNYPLWLTESALLCKPEWECGEAFRERQAIYLRNSFEYAVGHLAAYFWYSHNNVDWNNCELINEYKRRWYPAWFQFEQLIRK
jgi:hypothetical protein